MAPPTVFITGLAGFLGSHLAEYFLARGHRVVGCDNLSGGYEDNVPAGAEFHRADCNDAHAMRELTRGCELVLHTACAAYEGMSVFSPVHVTQNTFGASVSVFTAAIANGAKRVVFCSSMARYGTNEVPFREGLTPKPQDPYGIAKLAAEQVLQTLCETHGVEWAVAVPHNIIGPRQKYDDPYRNVASIMINRMLQGQQPYVYGDGSQRRCFSYVGDVVPVLARVALDPDAKGEVFNVGPDEEFVSILELAHRIAKLLEFDVAPIHTEARPREVHLATCSADKARARLGYQTKHSLDDGLRAMIEYIKKRGTRPFEYHLALEIENELTPKTWSKKLL